MADREPVIAVICGICNTPRKQVVNAFLAAGRSGFWIEREMRKLGSPTKSETVNRHRTKCLNGNVNFGVVSAEGIHNTDFAQAVRDEANRMLAAGELRIKAEHGLAAQGLLDRRAEHAANRTLLLNIGRLLSGGRSVPAEVIIEGEWQEIDASPDDSTARYPQLAPPDLIASG